MSWNADDRIHREYVARLISGDVQGTNQGNVVTPLFKIRSDPRVTPIGKVIRKTSMDELPQLFNVLKGNMSLVGPRPPLRYETEQYQSWHLRRVLEMKPGITGLWQVEGRSKTTFDEMVRLDLRYVNRSSLLFDLKILFKTVKVVLTCEGAK
jgi:lipopolysaccharide/colanic/teichoic acid biosynthesis glycosyltransferase